MLRFIIKSHTFKRVFAAALIFIVLVIISDKLFDHFWGKDNAFALTNLDDVYNPPQEYDNIKRVNMVFLPPDKLCIEGNMKLKAEGNQKNFAYVDTFAISFPGKTNEFVNKLYFRFENSKSTDSIFLVTAKSENPVIFWKQIFLSSVKVINLNKILSDTALFRIDPAKLKPEYLLSNNDTLINMTLKYFNVNRDTLNLAECGRNSYVFKTICDRYTLPCRYIMLQGGDADLAGYDEKVGYPTHVVCEVYSSRFQKWYIIDPTYGLRFKEKGTDDYINAVEISNRYFFTREKDIVQDSVLSTKRTLVGRDYFKYYENIYYSNDSGYNKITEKFFQYFYSKYSYGLSYSYSNSTPFLKNGKNYLFLKTGMYLALSINLGNFIFFILIRRLMQAKKPKKTSII